MANTFDTSRVGGGTYELAQDANGNYNLKSVGFNQVNKLNLPDLKDSNTSVADTTKKATEDTIKTQTTEVFKPSNVYQGGDGGGGQSYQTMADSKFAKEAKDASVKQAAQPMTKIDTGKTTGKFLASGAAGSASLLGDKTSDKFLTSGAAGGAGISNTYKSPTMAMKENEFAQGQYTGLKPVQSAVQNTVGNVIDSVKNNKAVQMAGSVLGFAMNPIMGGVRMVAGMLPKDSPQNTFDRGYFPTNDSGRIGTDPATNVFGGMNAVSAFGNVSQGAQKRIDTRNKTSTKLSGAKKENFDAKTKEFEAQKKAYDDKRDNTVPDKGYTRTATERKANPGRQDANTMSGGSDSAGGKTRVICTELHRTKELSTRDWVMDIQFTYKKLSAQHVKGYLLWAEPTVKHIQKYPRYRKVWKHIAQHRANDIAWRLNEGKFDLLGRIYAGIGEPVCWALGNFVSDRQISKYNLTHWRRA